MWTQNSNGRGRRKRENSCFAFKRLVTTKEETKNKNATDFPGGAVVKNPPANAGDTGSSPGPGRSHMPRSN